jgi:hypothetical protein
MDKAFYLELSLPFIYFVTIPIILPAYPLCPFRSMNEKA